MKYSPTRVTNSTCSCGVGNPARWIDPAEADSAGDSCRGSANCNANRLRLEPRRLSPSFTRLSPASEPSKTSSSTFPRRSLGSTRASAHRRATTSSTISP